MNDQRSFHSYAEREPAASPATGIKSSHDIQQNEYMQQAMAL